jgi:hypothetical protein
MWMRELFLLTAERHTDPLFFRRSAFRSPYFIANTITLGLALLGSVSVLARTWSLVPSFTRVWLMIAPLGMVLLWMRAIIDHRKIRRLFESGEIRELTPALDRALRAAASMTHSGLMYTFFIGGTLIVNLAIVAVSPHGAARDLAALSCEYDFRVLSPDRRPLPDAKIRMASKTLHTDSLGRAWVFLEKGQQVTAVFRAKGFREEQRVLSCLSIPHQEQVVLEPE